ncbi:hypothetical protein ACFFNY_07895 [Paenibacillus hodogayensis]|uniref:Uncharacterized protein n=1 Tax=Paenibacillus hodogayensis TaxID=279208 RepID=A0ABV5VT95_9BACL
MFKSDKESRSKAGLYEDSILEGGSVIVGLLWAVLFSLPIWGALIGIALLLTSN